MAIILPPEQTWRTTIPQAFGAVNTGAGSVLQALAQDKLNSIASQRQAEQQQQLYGPIARQLGHPEYTNLGPENLTKLLVNQQKQAAEYGDINSYNKINNVLQGMSEGQIPATQTAQQAVKPVQTVGETELTVKQPPQPIIERQTATPVPIREEGARPQRVQMPSFADFMAQQRASGIQISPKREKELGGQYNQLKRDAEERYKTDLQDWRESQKMKTAEEKEGTGQLKALRETAQDAETKLNTYKELAGYAKSGELMTGPAIPLLRKYNLEDLVLNPTSRQFQAAVNRLVLEAAKDLKGNLSDKDILFLQQTMPSLSNTPEGLAKLLNILTLKEHLKILPYEEAKNITAKTKTSPRNISDLAYDRSEKERKTYGRMIADLAQGKSFRTRTNNTTGDRQIEYRGSWYEF